MTLPQARVSFTIVLLDSAETSSATTMPRVRFVETSSATTKARVPSRLCCSTLPQDYMIFDPFINGVAELHDRHRDLRLDVDNMSYEELLALEERIGDVNTGLSEEVILKSMKQRKHIALMAILTQKLEPCCICQVRSMMSKLASLSLHHGIQRGMTWQRTSTLSLLIYHPSGIILKASHGPDFVLEGRHDVDKGWISDLTNRGHHALLFDFADKYRGKYDSSISVAQKYYRSVSGYADELLWAAAWLYKATNNQYYLDYLGENGDALGGTGWAMTEFGWDVKYAGVQTLVAKFLMGGKANKHASIFGKYQEKAEFFMCSCLGKSTQNVQKTPGGLIYKQRWNNLQFVTSASFLLTVYSDYLTSARKNLHCSSGSVAPSELLSFAKSQVDYILGDNPRATSYMVGYDNNYPKQVHHRGSSIVSVKVDPSFVSCRGGYATWFSRKASDPNLLTGAIVGGPDAYDNFADHRDNYEQTEPATYNNAPLLGILARFHGGHSGYNQLLPDMLRAQLNREVSSVVITC